MAVLEGKVALVTGSGRGLGRECARIFAREGASVVVVDIQAELGHETVKIIKDAGGEAIFVNANVSKTKDVQAMVQAAIDTYGGLDCAVNNAVRSISRLPLADITEEDWDQALAVNLTGVFLCMKYEIRAMLKRGGGAIVSVGSGDEHSAVSGLAFYMAAKHGMLGLTKVGALDYGKHGIRINAIGPGSMWTPLMREAAAKDSTHIQTLAKMSTLGRLAEPAEVAEAAVWLCSPAASYVTGHTMVVDGGAVLAKPF